MNNTPVTPVEEDEIDLKAIFSTLYRYKISIILIALLSFMLAAAYAYFKPSVYTASTSIELQAQRYWGGQTTDFMTQAFGGGSTNLDNEQLVLQSRFLAQKALSYLDIGTRYYTTRGYREVELYREAPFIVNIQYIDERAYGLMMELVPLDTEHFELRIDPPSQWTVRGILRRIGLLEPLKETPITYSGEHTFGETIATPWFKLQVRRIAEMGTKPYRFSVMPNEEMWGMVQGGITTSLPTKMGSILLISYQDNSPLRAKEVVNAVAQAYLDQEIERKTAEADHTLAFIDGQLDAINKALQSSQKNLERFKQSNIVVDISEKATLMAEKLSDYESKLQELDIQQNVLSNLQEYISSNDDISGIALGAEGFANENLMQMIAELKKKTVERNALLVEYTPLHPDVVKLSESISSLRRSIMYTLDSTLAVIVQRKQSLNKIISDYKRSLEALPVQEQRLANLTRSTMVNEKIYEFLLEKRAETAILRSSTVSKTRVIDKAMVPAVPTKPKRSLIAVVGLILGLIGGIALAFLREFIDNTVKSKEDIEQLTTIPLYGMIPTVKGKKFNSIFFEAFRALRTNLEFMRSDTPYKTIAVTSTVSGEGKTTVASNLAAILAKGGKKVVVLDLDMRRAKLSEYFDLGNEKGLSTLLSHRHTLDEVLQHSEQDGVDVIAAGPVPPNPSELIMSEHAETLINTLRERYDHVILDTPPVGLVTDAAILMHRADASLLVARYGYSKKEFVRGLDRLIKDHKIEHVGLVFNGVNLEKNYGYGYGYGYKYGGDKYYS
ncbi:polysaccharide biosynthesis tyrosine autokinase [Sulfurimonas sp. HSL-1656]|uniref:GumC family protein n=1 Tax=Thiomicrolovo subterrani TaxID=3131934 RepID=UPI0031F7D69C